MIVESLMDFEPTNLFVRLTDFIRDDVKLYLKLEMFNPGGSIKFKTAVGIVRSLETSGALRPGQSIIETTSGNMGIALALIARHRRYGFVCVTDDKITPHNRALIEAYEGTVVIMPRSTLSDRFSYIRDRIASDGSLVWTRQFANDTNPHTHETTTAREILNEFPHVNAVFVGTGTAGTLAGIGRAFQHAGHGARLVAVDAEGSAHFASDGAAKRRLLPGIGASERSAFLDALTVHDIVCVPEGQAIATCRDLVHASGWLLGASSGSILFAIRELQGSFCSGDTVIGIAADSGERYLSGVYDNHWVAQNFPDVSLEAVTLPGPRIPTEVQPA